MKKKEEIFSRVLSSLGSDNSDTGALLSSEVDSELTLIKQAIEEHKLKKFLDDEKKLKVFIIISIFIPTSTTTIITTTTDTNTIIITISIFKNKKKE